MVLQRLHDAKTSEALDRNGVAQWLASLDEKFLDVLEELRIASRQLDDAALAPLATSLLATSGTRSFPRLRFLDLSANALTDHGCVLLAECAAALRRRPIGGLVTLLLAGNKIGPEGAEAMAMSFFPQGLAGEGQGNEFTLSLSENPIGDEGVVAVATAVRIRSCKVNLHFFDVGCGPDGCNMLAETMDFVGCIDIGKNPIPQAALGTVAASLQASTRQLGLSYLAREGASLLTGASSLSEGLSRCTSLQTLDLAGDLLRDSGLHKLGQALAHLTTSVLEDLDLSFNRICDGDLLANFVGSAGRNLLCLSLEGNELSDSALVAFSAGVSTSRSLRRLNMARNRFSDSGAVALAAAMRKQCSAASSSTAPTIPETVRDWLQRLRDLGGGPPLHVAARRGIQVLDLSFNTVADEGARVLTEVPSLLELKLEGSAVGMQGSESLLGAVKASHVRVEQAVGEVRRGVLPSGLLPWPLSVRGLGLEQAEADFARRAQTWDIPPETIASLAPPPVATSPVAASQAELSARDRGLRREEALPARSVPESCPTTPERKMERADMSCTSLSTAPSPKPEGKRSTDSVLERARKALEKAGTRKTGATSVSSSAQSSPRGMETSTPEVGRFSPDGSSPALSSSSSVQQFAAPALASAPMSSSAPALPTAKAKKSHAEDVVERARSALKKVQIQKREVPASTPAPKVLLRSTERKVESARSFTGSARGPCLSTINEQTEVPRPSDPGPDCKELGTPPSDVKSTGELAAAENAGSSTAAGSKFASSSSSSAPAEQTAPPSEESRPRAPSASSTAPQPVQPPARPSQVTPPAVPKTWTTAPAVQGDAASGLSVASQPQAAAGVPLAPNHLAVPLAGKAPPPGTILPTIDLDQLGTTPGTDMSQMRWALVPGKGSAPSPPPPGKPPPPKGKGCPPPPKTPKGPKAPKAPPSKAVPKTKAADAQPNEDANSKAPFHRKLYWKQIDIDDAEGTIFQEAEKEASSVGLDIDALTRMFEGEKEKSARLARRSGALLNKAQLKSVGMKILTDHRARNIAIVLKRLPLSTKELTRVLRSLSWEASTVSTDDLEQITEVIPTKEESEKLREYRSPEAQILLRDVEQAILPLAVLNRATARVRLLCIARSARGQFSATARSLKSIRLACDAIHKSSTLRDVMKLALELGNYINHGDSSKGAKAIAIGSLITLKDFKTGRMSSLHFLCASLLRSAAERNAAEALAKELRPAAIISKLQVQTLQAAVRSFERDLDVILLECRNYVQEYEDDQDGEGERRSSSFDLQPEELEEYEVPNDASEFNEEDATDATLFVEDVMKIRGSARRRLLCMKRVVEKLAKQMRTEMADTAEQAYATLRFCGVSAPKKKEVPTEFESLLQQLSEFLKVFKHHWDEVKDDMSSYLQLFGGQGGTSNTGP